MVGIEVVDGSAGVDSYGTEIPGNTLWPFRQKKNIGSKRLHQNAIMNQPSRSRARIAQHRGEPISSVEPSSQLRLIVGIRPNPAIKSAERNAAPLQVVRTQQIVLYFDVHYYRA